MKESHLRLVQLEEEHARCKWKLIAIKNGKDVDVEVNHNEDIVKAIQTSTESYKKHQDVEMKWHLTAMQKIEEEKNRLDEEIIKVMTMI